MNLRQRLADHVVVADGAMGSELIGRIPDVPRIDLAALEHPKDVLHIHLDYLAAGAEILQTATFATSRPRLRRLHAESETEVLNAAAVKLARDARDIAGVDCLVAGSIGPVAGLLDPDEPGNRAEIAAAFSEQAAILAGRGADLLVLESFFRLDELRIALAAVREITKLPIIALLTFPAERAPHPWESYARQVTELDAEDVTAVGLSCAPGPLGTLEIVQRLPRLTHPLAVEPNAGMVVQRPGRALLSPATPSYLASFARQAVSLGAQLVGSCCGTGPEHTRAIAAAVKGTQAVRPVSPRIVVSAPRREPRREPESSLAAKLAAGCFVHVVQVDPPRGANADRVLDAARRMAADGRVDAVDINSNPLARLRMDALWLACEIMRETGLETIPHITPRDASMMGLEAQLLGAWRAGIRNLLAITGDPSLLGDYPGQFDVNQVDIFELVRAVGRMAEGADWTGNPIGDPPAFHIGVAVNPNAENLDEELTRFERKIAAGARFAMSQVFFEWAPWERFLDRFGGTPPVPCLVPIWPLTSAKLAMRLHFEVPGIVVPRMLRERLHNAGARAEEIGRQHAIEMLAGAPDRAQGVYLIAPFKNPGTVLDLLGSQHSS